MTREELFKIWSVKGVLVKRVVLMEEVANSSAILLPNLDNNNRLNQ